MKQEIIFGLVTLMASIPIIALVDFLIDKYGIEEDKTLYYLEDEDD
jgi:ABC-type proline/glycine betaine transport system permease subunit